MRISFRLLCSTLAVVAGGFLASPAASAQFAPNANLSATTIPSASLMQTAELRALLQSPGKHPPLVLQVGSRIFYAEAHIPGAQYAGPGSQPSGLALLEKTVAPLPKDKAIVLYCGCCPWNHCPNVGPAFQRLRDLGFTNVKVLYLANNFGDDWVAKGYPTEKK
ncbi:MAG TPA: rhodanese-like domain-containing protein [Terracidiphilus sp.]|jgi:rhodanese-related sulfurtransferase|nr:rhodanese-like domain-containing protein [Terracidiphilus sp.]